MNKLDKLRRALLGDELYNQCEKYGLSEDELQGRLNYILKEPLLIKRLKKLDINYNYLSKCTKDDFAKLCGLKDSENAISCLSDFDKINILYKDELLKLCMNKRCCAYIGSGYDSFPLYYLDGKIDCFIYIESFPKSEGEYEYGNTEFGLEEEYESYEHFSDSWYKNSEIEFKKAGYVLWKQFDDNIHVYHNKSKNQYLIYFTSTIFPSKEPSISSKLIEQCRYLYLSGFDPDRTILNKLNYPLTLYVSPNQSIEPCDNKFVDSLVQFLYKNYVKNIKYIKIKHPTVQDNDDEESFQIAKDAKFTEYPNLLSIYYTDLEDIKGSEDSDVYIVEPEVAYREQYPYVYDSGKDIPFDKFEEYKNYKDENGDYEDENNEEEYEDEEN